MVKTILSPDTLYVCTFCDTEFDYKPFICCGEYKGVTSIDDVLEYYPDLYEIGN